jgi:hypothetical protein
MSEDKIFAAALECSTAEERAAYLDQACGADGELRQRIMHLLVLHESSDPLLDRTPGELLEALGSDAATRESVVRHLAPYLAASTRPDSIGRLGHYEVLDVLGQGGFGIVVKAFDEQLHRAVAIKVLVPHLAATSPPRKRFLREARAGAQLRDEYVVRIYAVEEQPLPYLVMELIEGQTLQDRLDENGPLEVEEVIRLGRQIALGLAAAHRHDLIHRDVKPANILIEAGTEPRVKLTDFGLARIADDASLTQSGVIAGTPAYMAPEQFSGAVVDHRADLFSLGSVLYAMVTGRPPFRARNTIAVLKRVVEDAPRPICQVIDGVPVGLCAVIRRLLEKNPAERFATARQAAEALEGCMTDRSCGSKCQAPPRPARGLRRWLHFAAAALMLASAVALGIWGVERFGGMLSGTGRTADVGSGFEPREPRVPMVDEYPSAASLPPDAIVVASPLDDGGEGTLRWAVDQANIRHGEDTIVFDPAVFNAPTTIALSQGPLVLLDPARTTIVGSPAGVTLSGANQARVVVVGGGENDEPASVRLVDLTIAHGRSANQGFETEQQGLGGGILSWPKSTLELVGCTLRDNQAHDGAGVFNLNGTLTIINCTFTRNRAVSEGGGVRTYGGGARTTVIHCTLVDNTGEGAGGIFTHGGARTEVYNSLFVRNSVTGLGNGISETVGAFNLFDDNSGEGTYGQTGTNARVGPLGRYGGPTETFPLLTGSPAVDAGDNARVPQDVHTDQRGASRIARSKADIGAFEVQ